jgi:16S rRNA (uracil1498-N3)-methyltransferase
MTPRLLIPIADLLIPDQIGPRSVTLDRARAHYLTRVLRLSEGDPIEVFDGQGGRFQGRVTRSSSGQCEVRIESRLPGSAQGPLTLTLAQCLSSSDKMDWTIEKAVELGVSNIIPLFSERSVVRLDRDRSERKMKHWEAIIEAACMQSGQDRLPSLALPQNLQAWLAGAERPGLKLALDPGARLPLVTAVETALPSLTLANETTEVTLLIGPESGLSGAERAAARRAGFEAVSLGPRVLRTETAGLAALAVLAALAGDFRPATSEGSTPPPDENQA